MNYIDLERSASTTPPGKGKFLIAAPFLSDPNFSRSVVLLCEHGDEGTIGFVLNQPHDLTFGDLVPEVEHVVPPVALYNGGPVQPDTLHIMHRIPEKLGGMAIAPGIYWGGSYETLITIIKENDYDENDLRLFLGYSGWAAGQLVDEMKEGSWFAGDAKAELVFDTEPHLVWKKSVMSLGNNFSILANMPIDPQLN
jgi:putative transcriptional regulator